MDLRFFQPKRPSLFPTIILLLSCFLFNSSANRNLSRRLQVSENKRFLETESGEPFFWLGDTGWLLFSKLGRDDAEKYLEDRHQKGFNVIQVMVLHDVKRAVNVYGDSALVNNDVAFPMVTPGDSPGNASEYDYWDHVDYIIGLAQKKGLYMALVPVWGSNVKSGNVTNEKAAKYAAWLAERYKGRPNVVWMNGGDLKGSDSTATWNTIGQKLKKMNPGQLVTFHPFGRTQSSTWFHAEQWLDFNMFQSGHRRYDQDTTELAYGEDNWKYVVADYARIPVKPTLDGEPSYEGIPQGLHDPSQPYWTDADIRRYGYWSVFAGGCGFTYGHNAIMQFHITSDTSPAYGVRETWADALGAPGASQMKHLKELILSRPYYERIPAQDLIAGKNGEKYDYIVATRGLKYAFVYTCNGSTFNIGLGKLAWHRVKAAWYNPRDGQTTRIGSFEAKGVKAFDPPGEKTSGNDWVLILDQN